MQDNVLMPGDAAGNYNKKWTETFDLKFLIMWCILFVLLLGWTLVSDPDLFESRAFFLRSGIKTFCNDGFVTGRRDVVQTLL